MKNRFDLRMKDKIKDDVYKKASKDNKSVNTTLNRLLSHSLLEETTFFEMQYLDRGDRFGFKEDHLQNETNTNKPIYTLEKIDSETREFLCKTKKGVKVKFKFLEVYNKPVFII